jgi:hypothetical protein
VGKLSEPLPGLLDAKHLAAELGVTRAAAEKVMEALSEVRLPGLRKRYVRRVDVERLLAEYTFSKDEVPRKMYPPTSMARQRANAPGPAPKG